MVAFIDATSGRTMDHSPVVLDVALVEEDTKKGIGSTLSSGGSLATIASLATTTSTMDSTIHNKEKWWSTAAQVALPFFIAGIGTIGAGIVLGTVQHWPVFLEVPELFILVPALLGLKGNLDMCLASRLSTQTNLGNMETVKQIWSMIVGNIALVQVQAIVAALLVSLFAVSVGAVMDGLFDFKHAILLAASSMVTATSSCFILDFVMIAVIVVSHKIKVNPDNVATPLAASFGDVVSISLLSNVASFLHSFHETNYYILFIILAVYLLLLPFWIWITHSNQFTRPVLKTGWVPVLSALMISGFGGLVLDAVVGLFDGFVIFQPIINGIGGNLVSVQASRISTMLHQSSLIGILPPHAQMCIPPWRALFTSAQARTARILLLMSLPGQLVFIFAADYISTGAVSISAAFVFSYLTVSCLQLMLLLYIAHVMIHFMWKKKIDPDNNAIPYLTSIGDLLGTSFLAVAFIFLQAIGAHVG
ncbi:solute carrier family 41 member 1 [Ischnura elegans]|uniref:solute carrier family 41 member 1 n=1 Tax=Ischnura elegans TaxID=197161 RepID=UPI001ED8B2A8|nr:solute carrier family 41 member 1 [Ischnura elegans]